MQRGRLIIILGLSLLFFTILTIILVLILPDKNIPSQIRETESGISYKLFYLEGMPCIYVTEGVGNAKTGGPSCDWSKWQGR